MIYKDIEINNWFFNEITKQKDKYKYFNILQKVSIVLPSYKRQDFILRQIIYWHNSGVHLIILDGTNESMSSDILEFISTMKNITYINDAITFEERLNIALSYINTPYVISLCDDEFYIKSTLSKLVVELDNNSELSGCIGQVVGFNYNIDKEKVLYDYSYFLLGHNALENNIEQRIVEKLENYIASTAYGLFRKEVWQKGWGETKKYSSAYVAEMHQAMTTYLFGKYIVLDELFWLRSNENAPIHTSNWNRELLFHEWWKSIKYNDERNQFIKNLASIVEQRLGIKNEEAKKLVIRVFNEHVKAQQNSVKSIVSKLIRKVLSESIILKIKVILKKAKPIPQNNKLKYEFTKYVCTSNIEEISKEVMEIEHLIKEFYLAKL